MRRSDIFLFSNFMAGVCACARARVGCQVDSKAWLCIALQSAAVHLDHQEERENHKRLMREMAPPLCSPLTG